MMTRTPTMLILCGALVAGSLALPALAYTGENLAKHAKISMQAAQTIALQTEPGKIANVELEREAGGSGLRYSFDIKPQAGGMLHEVGIDAQTGTVLENTPDNGQD